MPVSYKAVRVANYIKTVLYETGMISHSCGVREPRELTRHHARIITEKGLSMSMAELYPEKIPGIKANIKARL